MLLSFYSSAQPNLPVHIDPATGLPIAENLVARTNDLDKMSADADLVFKGRVVFSLAITNSSFPQWGKPHATRFNLISVLKGNNVTNAVVFWHNTAGPLAWSGGAEPAHHQFEAGKTYLIFAKDLDKPDYLFSVQPDATNRPNEFRQLYAGGVFRTLDDRPLAGLSISNALWLELNLLLNDKNPTNQLYAIQHLGTMSKRCTASWDYGDYFNREAVLKAVSPFVNSADDQIAFDAIGCFQLVGNTGTIFTDLGGELPPLPESSVYGYPKHNAECAAQVLPYATNLVWVINNSPFTLHRAAAIAALSGTGFSIVSNSLPLWLNDSADQVRSQAVLLLPDFPGELSERMLQKLATDSSPQIRSMVANAIGNGKLQQLLPTLMALFSDSQDSTNSEPLLMRQEGWPGTELWSEDAGSVHANAGYALLKFDVNQVGDILKTNLNDVGFRLQFLCKLAEDNPGPWLTNLVSELKTWRGRIWKEVDISGNEPKTNFFQARTTLEGAYFDCWNIIYHHLIDLPDSAFANGKLDWVLDTLEDAGSADSNRPIEIYGLYKLKGLNDRAARFRRENGKYNRSYDLSQFFDRVDAEKSRQQK